MTISLFYKSESQVERSNHPIALQEHASKSQLQISDLMTTRNPHRSSIYLIVCRVPMARMADSHNLLTSSSVTTGRGKEWHFIKALHYKKEPEVCLSRLEHADNSDVLQPDRISVTAKQSLECCEITSDEQETSVGAWGEEEGNSRDHSCRDEISYSCIPDLSCKSWRTYFHPCWSRISIQRSFESCRSTAVDIMSVTLCHDRSGQLTIALSEFLAMLVALVKELSTAIGMDP